MQKLQQDDEGSRAYTFDEWIASYGEANTKKLYTLGSPSVEPSALLQSDSYR